MFPIPGVSLLICERTALDLWGSLPAQEKKFPGLFLAACVHAHVPTSHRGFDPESCTGTSRCPLLLASLLPLQVFDDFIFVFFAMEMVLKMVALGIFGKKCYLGDTWNRLDFFIVMAG